MMGSVRFDGCDLYFEEAGEGVPILLIPPSGATAATWGLVVEELARIGRVIAYDRRGYARTGGEPVRLVSRHTADAAAILEYLQAGPAVVVGTSAGATIAVDLAVRRPDLLQAVIAHEAAWRASRHLPNASQLAAVAKIGWLALRGRHSDAAETLLRAAYAYRDGEPRGTHSPKNGGGSQGKTLGRPCGLPKLRGQRERSRLRVPATPPLSMQHPIS
jgi:pimeloyl-ACP methyl ester carboxylesterase